MPIKLLALDLDGTLVADLHTIPARTQAAIKAATARGVYVIIATGREYAVTQKFVHLLGLTTPVICYQGAVIYDPQTGEAIASESLTLPLAYQLIDLARAQNLALSLYFNGKAYTEHSTPQSRTIYSDTGAILVEVSDLKQALTDPPLKGLIVHPPEEGATIVKRVQTVLGDRLRAIRSLDILIEVTAPNVSKGYALATLADYYDISQSEVMAIGDQDNDIEMIAWAGLGVAMGNASTGAKVVADYIAPPVSEEGAAWAIEYFILRPGHSVTGS